MNVKVVQFNPIHFKFHAAAFVAITLSINAKELLPVAAIHAHGVRWYASDHKSLPSSVFFSSHYFGIRIFLSHLCMQCSG